MMTTVQMNGDVPTSFLVAITTLTTTQMSKRDYERQSKQLSEYTVFTVGLSFVVTALSVGPELDLFD